MTKKNYLETLKKCPESLHFSLIANFRSVTVELVTFTEEILIENFTFCEVL